MDENFRERIDRLVQQGRYLAEACGVAGQVAAELEGLKAHALALHEAIAEKNKLYELRLHELMLVETRKDICFVQFDEEKATLQEDLRRQKAALVQQWEGLNAREEAIAKEERRIAEARDDFEKGTHVKTQNLSSKEAHLVAFEQAIRQKEQGLTDLEATLRAKSHALQATIDDYGKRVLELEENQKDFAAAKRAFNAKAGLGR